MWAELFHADGRTERQKDMTKLIIAFRNFANSCKKSFDWWLLSIYVSASQWVLPYKNIKKNERKMKVENIMCICILTMQFIYICTTVIPRSFWVQHFKLVNESHSPWEKPLPVKYSHLPRPTTGYVSEKMPPDGIWHLSCRRCHLILLYKFPTKSATS